MKILMLGWELPPHNSGGLGVACYRLCKALSNIGADIEFIIPYEGEYDKSFMNVTSSYSVHYDDVTEHLFPYDNTIYKESNSHDQNIDIDGHFRRYENAVAKVVDAQEFDVIHAHDWMTFRAALRAKQITGKPLILHVHSVERDRSGGNSGNLFIRDIEETIMHLADKIVAVSNKTKQDIIDDYGIPADLIEVVYNSIDTSEFDLGGLDKNSYKYILKLRSLGYKIVLSAGRITIQKGLPNLLYAAKEVICRAPKTIFLFVGDGDMFNEMLELSASLGISKNVLFAGFQRGKKWRESFLASNLFVMPSISEPFGIAPLEAVGYRVPTIVSKQSGVSEVLKNSLKVDYWDVNELANDITSIIQNDSLANEISSNAYREYKNISWHNSAKDMMSIYEKHVGQLVS
jgi:glycosyltransferase involved in cell wall biosynthesis